MLPLLELDDGRDAIQRQMRFHMVCLPQLFTMHNRLCPSAFSVLRGCSEVRLLVWTSQHCFDSHCVVMSTREESYSEQRQVQHLPELQKQRLRPYCDELFSMIRMTKLIDLE